MESPSSQRAIGIKRIALGVPSVIFAGCSLVGFFAGYIFALMGMGPGMMIVPTLHLLCRYDLKKAVTGSLLLLVPVSLGSALSHHLHSNPFSAYILWILPGSLIGIDLGLMLRRRLSSRTLKMIFCVFLALILIRHWGQILDWPLPLPSFEIRFEWYHHILIGCLASTLAASMGIGGGVLIMTTYFGVLGFPARETAVASACVVCLNSCLSSYKSRTELYWNKNLTIILGCGLLGAFTGGMTASQISEDTLRLLVGGFLLIVFFNMIRGLLGRKEKG